MTTVLTVQGLSRAFGGIRAVDDVSFQTSATGITGLIGPNGAGKTTLLNLIAGSTRVQSGRVLFDGCDITGRSAASIARQGLCRATQTPRVAARLPCAARSRRGPRQLASLRQSAALLPPAAALLGRVDSRRSTGPATPWRRQWLAKVAPDACRFPFQ